jgi:hypothetical protein
MVEEFQILTAFVGQIKEQFSDHAEQRVDWRLIRPYKRKSTSKSAFQTLRPIFAH